MSKPAATLSTLALAVTLAATSFGVSAQTPGTAITESTVGQDILTLFSVAGQLYPDVFVNGSSWYSYSGFTYRYFANSGIYAGVKDGNVFLLGGPYGSVPTSFGTVATISSSLQQTLTAATDFTNISSVKTTYDLPRLFDELSMEWTSVSGAVTIVSTMQMTRKGVEQVNGISTEHLQVTLTASNTTGASSADMWVDANGTVRHFILNGFDYGTGATADAVGRSLVSGMLLVLAAIDTPTVQNLISDEFKNNPVLTKSSKNKSFGSRQLPTLTLTVHASVLEYTVDLSDFGSFTLATSYTLKTNSTLNSSYKLISMTLR